MTRLPRQPTVIMPTQQISKMPERQKTIPDFNEARDNGRFQMEVASAKPHANNLH